ncbi:7-cyano-7-deazaguanine synthase [Candidatus Woesearchaeota archaeon]|nr:7-cyano-7-deazaguanine synthase [Candidatus Woesearchaeota archaeon]
MKAILLLSGGIDSPVAGWMMKRKGYELIAVHFSGEPFVKKATEDKARMLAAKIGCRKFIVIPFGFIQAEVVTKCRHRYYYIIIKRFMLRIAERLAQEEGASAIIKGDSIGQVGSQTIPNMSVISKAISMRVSRPLLCFDKDETIALARKIGTYELSIGPEMCSVLGPKHPATKARLDIIEREESNLDGETLIAEALRQRMD